jgi:deoxyribose-phosphate aldolase
MDEIKYALAQGADEIDTVLSRGRFLNGDFGYVAEEIRAQKEICGDKNLKVILETGELGSVENIRKASEIALTSGADFLKTSTGKSQPAATPEAFFVMAETIREFYEKTGGKVGIKAAGGIATAEHAQIYLNLLKNILGKEWITKHLFRIGASRLLDDLLSRMPSTNREPD